MTTKRRHILIGALLLAGAAGTGAYAQTGFAWDPTQLPETKGTVKQYTLTPHGDVDGLILTDGTEVKLPKHLSVQVVYAIHPGDTVTVHGLRARAIPLVDAASVTNDATGASVIDSGPPDRSGSETAFNARVAMPLHGKRGEVNGALLDNGTILRLPPPEAARWSNLLQAGQSIGIRGRALTTPLGTVVQARAIGATLDQLTELAGKPPKEPKGPKHAGPAWGGFAPPPPPRN